MNPVSNINLNKQHAYKPHLLHLTVYFPEVGYSENP